jgi:hypothetical protein
VLTPERTGLDGLALLAVRLAVTLAFVVPSYYLLENPIRRHRRISTRQARFVLPAAVTAVVMLAVAGTEAAPPDVREYLHPVAVPPAVLAGRSPGARPRVLLVGDSVPDRLAPTLTEHPDELGVEVRSLARFGCGVWTEITRIRLLDGSIGPDGQGCADQIKRWTTDGRAFDPDVSILMLGAPGRIDREIDGQWRTTCDPIARERFRVHLADAVDRLHADAPAVVLTTTAPFGAGPRRAERDDDVDCINEDYRQVAAPRPWLRLVDLASYVCPEHECLATIEGVPLRPDGLHYHGPSAAIVGTWVLDRALQAAAAP